MRIRKVWLAWAAAGVLSVSTAQAQNINGLINRPRVFNDHPTSTLTMLNSNSVNPGTASINDVFAAGGAGANRHDVSLSSDAGATAHTFNIGDKFFFKAEVNLTALTNSPRKEAGLRLDSSPASGVGDAQFFINTDAGEIVGLGGGGPFHSFGNNAGGNGYTPGTKILMGIKYIGKMGATPATLEYFIDRGLGAGVESSGPQPYTNLEFGAVDFRASFYAQGGPSTAGDFVNGVFSNIMYGVIPEPTTVALGLMGSLGLLGLVRRRR
jgi:hypothetical protein